MNGRAPPERGRETAMLQSQEMQKHVALTGLASPLAGIVEEPRINANDVSKHDTVGRSQPTRDSRLAGPKRKRSSPHYQSSNLQLVHNASDQSPLCSDTDNVKLTPTVSDLCGTTITITATTWQIPRKRRVTINCQQRSLSDATESHAPPH